MGKLVPTAVIAACLLAGCADSEPVSTSLRALSEAQSDFSGRSVIVSGTLRSFETPKHYWIENDSFDRVALETADDLVPWLGRTIEVRGTFFYDPETGRRIEVEEFKALP